VHPKVLRDFFSPLGDFPLESRYSLVTRPLLQFRKLKSEVLALTGKIEEGLAAFDDALAKAAVSGAKGSNAEIHRLRGDLTGRFPYPDPAKAEDLFQHRPGNRLRAGHTGELRAATSLAACGVSRAGGARRATCSCPSTVRSPRTSTPPT
jgi:hypothetical protein